MTIEKMDSATTDVVRKLLEKGLPSILEEHGLSFKLGNARYDDDGVKFTGFRISVSGALSETEKALKQELEYRSSFAKADKTQSFVVELDSSKIASIQGAKYQLVGYKPRARKNPFIIKKVGTDAQYVLNAELVEKHFAKGEK